MENDLSTGTRGRDFYARAAKSLIKAARVDQKVSYKNLARLLEAQGTRVDVQMLINRRGGGLRARFARYDASSAQQLCKEVMPPGVNCSQAADFQVESLVSEARRFNPLTHDPTATNVFAHRLFARELRDSSSSAHSGRCM